MRRLKAVTAAFAAALVMSVGAASASAAVTVSPAGPYSASFATNGLTWTAPGSAYGMWTCPVSLSGSVGSTGSISVTSASITPNPCSTQLYTFSTPWSGQIVGSPGNYTAVIPTQMKVMMGLSFKCDYSGNLRLKLSSGTGAAIPSGELTATQGAPTCPKLVIAGFGGKITPALTITGSA